MTIASKIISFFLAIIQFFSINIFGKELTHKITVDNQTTYQTFEGFGTSSCWWSQMIDDESTARAIAEYLYSEEGLGLDIYRYNIGAGEKENPDTRIPDISRQTESFYVYDEESGEYVYDFNRDANARRMLDLAIENGAREIILFCNSPHYSMTASGQASGGLKEGESNLPKENYQAFVNYVLTIADCFVSEGYPITAVSPVNEPQWDWGGEYVSQEGCHYTADETVKLLEMFAVEMQKRGVSYKLRGPESGKMNNSNMKYIDKFFKSDILNDYCDTYSGHSYWMDNKRADKFNVGLRLKRRYSDKKYEMSEWCELPMTLDPYSIDSGIYMANVIADDLSLMNAVSWQSWTAVNSDGVLDIVDGKLIIYNRYYAYSQFSSFIKTGMKRVKVNDNYLAGSDLNTVAFSDGSSAVLVVINNSTKAEEITLGGKYEAMQVYVTDALHNRENTYSGEFNKKQELSAKSITTLVLR